METYEPLTDATRPAKSVDRGVETTLRVLIGALPVTSRTQQHAADPGAQWEPV
jgi:hypothetical protein